MIRYWNMHNLNRNKATLCSAIGSLQSNCKKQFFSSMSRIQVQEELKEFKDLLNTIPNSFTVVEILQNYVGKKIYI